MATEVKAGKSGTLISLHRFVAEKRPPRALRFDLNPPSCQTLEQAGAVYELFSLPLYFAGRTMELFRLVRASGYSER